ncbi:LysR family transcriptional regulator [Bordetella sp. N]|nr:LysR family transcriptional regulator [Bordetella sp. N]
MTDLNLGHMQAYALVIELGSFSAAADRLGISQPAISAQVKQLERRCGVRLVERVGRRATPTAAGMELLAHRDRIAAAVDAALEAVARHGTQVAGRIRLGAGATACIHFLPPILERLRHGFPELTVAVSTGNTDDFVADVIGNRLDLALVTLPAAGRALTVLPVLQEDFVAIAPAGMLPPGPVTPAALARTPLILFQSEANTRRLIDHWFAQDGVTARPVMELGSIEAIKEMVAAGLGSSLVPAMAVARAKASGRDAAQGDRWHCHATEAPLRRGLALVLRQDKPMTRALREVLRAIEAAPAIPAADTSRPRRR